MQQDAASPDEILTLQEAAAFLKLSDDTVRQHARDGVIPGRKIGPSDKSHWRFSRTALQEWVRS